MAYALYGHEPDVVGRPCCRRIADDRATAVGAVAQQGTSDYASAAVMLALLSGLLLIGLGLLRFGFITNFLSHPVVSGFITASGVIIALSQLRHLLGIEARRRFGARAVAQLFPTDLLATNPSNPCRRRLHTGFLMLSVEAI